MLLGIVHFAGSTSGHVNMFCENPEQYPIFKNAVLPLYLKLIESFSKTCPFDGSTSHPDPSWDYGMFQFPSSACFAAAQQLRKEYAREGITVNYNSGICRDFKWV